MSGIQIHTESPISPAKAQSIAPKNGNTANLLASNGAAITTSNTPGYPSARPGAGPPAPTPTLPQATNVHHGPPPPQPGATPISSSPARAVKPSLPPPPKVGETLRSPEYYAPAQVTPTTTLQPQPYPQQMTLPSPAEINGQPPASTTSTSFGPSFLSAPSSNHLQQSRPTPTNSFPASSNGGAQANLQHPPGYVQNPYASDLTPDQRYATEQASQSVGSQGLGYNERRETGNAGFEEEEGVWGMAKKWAKGASDTVGGYVNDMNEKLSK